jgi:uncharacterized protein involved in exopolysaccharide biosynthesis
LERLEVINIGSSDILQISYKDTDPKRAAAIVNKLIAAYLQNNLFANRGEAVAAREFIEKQLPKTKVNMRQAELALRSFKEENKVVALEEEARSAVEVIADLQRQVNLTQSELADAKAQSAFLTNQLGRDLQQAGAVTSISQSLAVQDLLKEVQQVESQLATEKSRFREDHPTIISLKSRKVDLERLLNQRVKRVVGGKRQQPNENLQISKFEQDLTEELAKSEARRLGLASQLAALSDVQATYRQQQNVLPKLEQKQRELEGELEAARSTYAFMLQKFQEMQIAENQNVANARIISFASVPNEPNAPRKIIYLGVGIVLSSLLSLGTALVLEARDQSIKTIDEAKKEFGFTVLGMIPSFKKSEKITSGNGDLERSTPEILLEITLAPPSALRTGCFRRT